MLSLLCSPATMSSALFFGLRPSSVLTRVVLSSFLAGISPVATTSGVTPWMDGVAPLSVPPKPGRAMHLVQLGGPAGVSPFAQFAEALTPLPGASGSDRALLSRLGLSSSRSFHPPSGPCYGSPRIDPPPSVRPARRESIGADGLVPTASAASSASAATTTGGDSNGPASKHDSAVVEAAAGGACVVDALLLAGDATGAAGTAASTATAAAAAAESTRRSPYPSSHRSPYGISHINARLSGGKRSATASGGSHAATVGSVGALSDVASLAGGSAPGSALDSDVKRSKTASRKLALPPSKLSHASAGGASTHPLTAGPTPMHPPTAPQHRVGGINVPQSAIIAGFAPDSAHGGAPGGSGGSSGSGGSGNSFIQNFAEHLIEGGGINLDPALMDQMIEGVEDANGADGSSMFDSGALSISSAKISAAKLKASKSRQGRPKKCNCTRSKCLKLYCDCFSVGQLCDGCNCQDCGNTEANREEIDKARKSVLKRSKNAFAAKFVEADGSRVVETKGKDSKHVRGCNCSKSRCIKNYCECWQMGIQCNAKCKCVNCSNGKPDSCGDEHQESAETATTAEMSSVIANLGPSLDVLVPNGPEDLTGDMYLEAPPEIPMPSRMPTLPPGSFGLGQGDVANGPGAELTLSDLFGAAGGDSQASGDDGAHSAQAESRLDEASSSASAPPRADADADDTGTGGRVSWGGGATGEATYSDIAAALESEATKADLKCTEPRLVTGVRTALEGVDPTELKQQAQNTASSVTVQAS